MRSRALIFAAIAAVLAVAATRETVALGRPGITPVPCPTQDWQPADPAFTNPLRPSDPGGIRVTPAKPSTRCNIGRPGGRFID